MSIRATYILNEHIKTLWVSEGLDTMEFYPGRKAPQEAGSRFVLYVTDQGRDTELYMVRVDTIEYRIVHTDYNQLQDMTSVVLDAFNTEDIETTTFSRDPSDPDIRFQFTAAGTSGHGQNQFSDQDEYYYQNITIIVKYTEV